MTQEEQSTFTRDWYNDPTTTKRERIFLEELFPELKKEKLTEFEKQLARCEWRGIDVNDLTKEAKEFLHRDSKTLLDIARKDFIEKACESFCEVSCQGYEQCGDCFADTHCKLYRMFRKKMEEQP